MCVLARVARVVRICVVSCPRDCVFVRGRGGGRLFGCACSSPPLRYSALLLLVTAVFAAQVQLEQSIGVLRSRLSTFVTLPHELGGREGGASLVDDISKVAQKLG